MQAPKTPVLRATCQPEGIECISASHAVVKCYHFKQLCMSMAAWAGAGLEHEEEPMRVKTEMR